MLARVTDRRVGRGTPGLVIPAILGVQPKNWNGGRARDGDVGRGRAVQLHPVRMSSVIRSYLEPCRVSYPMGGDTDGFRKINSTRRERQRHWPWGYSTGLGLSRCGLSSQLCPRLPVRPWASHGH